MILAIVMFFMTQIINVYDNYKKAKYHYFTFNMGIMIFGLENKFCFYALRFLLMLPTILARIAPLSFSHIVCFPMNLIFKMDYFVIRIIQE